MTDELMQWLAGEGADIAGTSYVKERLPKRFSALPYAVTIGVRLSEAVVNEIYGRAYQAVFRALSGRQRVSGHGCHQVRGMAVGAASALLPFRLPR